MKPYVNSDAQQMQLRVNELLFRMARRIGISIPEQNYPQVNLSKVSHYNGKTNEINLPKDKMHSGDEIGEEIGHFLRDYIRGQKSQEYPGILSIAHKFINKTPKYHDKTELLTDEFFGYLGRRILQDVTNKSDQLDFIGSPRQEDVVDELKGIRKKKRKLSTGNPEFKKQEVRRKDRLTHIRGYTYAEVMDLGKVDLKKVFEMPNQEVRYRFFRSDPQYDLNKPIKPGKVTKRQSSDLEKSEPATQESGLETVLKFIGIIGIFILFVLSTNTGNLTGYVINIKDNPINPDFLIFIFLIVLLIISIFNQFKPKKGKK